MPASILQAIGHTPLVPLRRISANLPQLIWAKCEHLNPGGSVKDRIARAIVEDARSRGQLSRGDTLVEATAGNTGLALAMVAAQYDYQLQCVMPEKMSLDKRQALERVGATVIITPNAPPSDPKNFQRVAEQIAQSKGYFLCDQFRNPVNPRAHEQSTAVELWTQSERSIGAFVAGAGTGGTITGVGRFLRSRRSSAKIVLADPQGSVIADWVETGTLGSDGPYAVEGIGGSEVPQLLDRDVVDAVERITDEESFDMARRLMQEEGLLVGGSSGTAVAAAIKVARHSSVSGKIVALLPDSWDRYASCDWMK